MKKIVLKISGMTCSACSTGLEKYLNKQEGIINASVNLVLSLATIEYENISVKTIEKYIADAGFKSLGEFKKIDDLETSTHDKKKFIILGIVVIFLMYASMAHMFGLPELPYLNSKYPVILSSFMFLITFLFLIFGFDILKSGWKNLIHKMPNMDTLVMFSVVCSFIYSLYGYLEILFGNEQFIHNLYFESTCMIIYFIKLGRFIEAKSKDKTKDALKKLVQITPEYAYLKKGDKTIKVSIDEIKEGDLLINKAGEKIAVDGIVTSGKSYVDESFITGEASPVLKNAQSNVIAGSILYDGYLEYQATRIGKSSTISQIISIVINATSTKSKTEKLADKISGYFVPIIMVIALIAFLVNLLIGSSFADSLTHLVTVLVVACPCALGLAVPLVNVVANGLCAKRGIFLRNGEVLEKAKDIDAIVFDKTGTLTYGKLNIYQMFNYSTIPDQELLNLVANIEALSNHPLASAFTVSKTLKVANFTVIPGIGIKGDIQGATYYLGNANILKELNLKNKENDYEFLTNNGCSIIYVVKDKKILALIGLRDIIRSNIKSVIQKFQKNKIEVVMLTGDNATTADIIASEIGINKVYASVLPQDKAKHIASLVAEGKKVAMVGDGINDAPALVKSSVGISLNDGTDIAADASDVILLNNDINNIFDLIKISKKSYRVIKQNLFWAFIYNICMIPIAAGVFPSIRMTPMLGSIAMTISSLTVVLNSYIFGRRKI